MNLTVKIRPIYLDNQATTPLAPEARAAMMPYMEERFGNPHSPHLYGREADAAVELARERVALALGAEPERLFFTSGATEAANWALIGTLEAGQRRGIVTVATEHACVLETALWLGGRGATTTVLPVGSDGLIDLEQAAEVINERVAILSVMAVNNEIGVIQPLAELSRLARSAGVLVHCDAAQSFGKLPTDLELFDLVTLSGHKMYGPKGIGALWVREGVAIAPLLHGGGQEGGKALAGGMRSGTLSPALCAGFGAAAEIAAQRKAADCAHAEALWKRALGLLDIPYRINGSTEHRWRGNLNVTIEGVDANRLISEVRGVAFSAASACASGSGKPSHVLSALGLSTSEARSSVRFGWGRYTTEDEIDRAFALINEAVRQQQRVIA